MNEKNLLIMNTSKIFSSLVKLSLRSNFINNKKLILITGILVLLIISGCKEGGFFGKSKEKRPITDIDVRKGTEGLTMAFTANAPPENVFEESIFPIAVRLNNKGACHIGSETGDCTTEEKGVLVFGFERTYVDAAVGDVEKLLLEAVGRLTAENIKGLFFEKIRELMKNTIEVSLTKEIRESTADDIKGLFLNEVKGLTAAQILEKLLALIEDPNELIGLTDAEIVVRFIEKIMEEKSGEIKETILLEEIKRLMPETIKGLLFESVDNLTADEIEGLTAEQIEGLLLKAIKEKTLTAGEIKEVLLKRINGLLSEGVEGLTPGPIGGLTPAQVEWLLRQVKGLTTEGIKELALTTIGELTPAEVNVLLIQAVNGLTDAEIKGLLLETKDHIIKTQTSKLQEEKKRQEFGIDGKSVSNPGGDEEFITINAQTKEIGAQSETRLSTILATACYPYKTIFGSSVCIDTDIYGMRKGQKACSITDLVFNEGQGAPVTVTKVETSMLYFDEDNVKPFFIIHIENKGNGEVISLDKVEQACTSEALEYKDFNTLIIRAFLSDKELDCSIGEDAPSTTIRLKEKKDMIRCKSRDGDVISRNRDAYTSPLRIELDYGYTFTISKDIIIEKVLTH